MTVLYNLCRVTETNLYRQLQNTWNPDVHEHLKILQLLLHTAFMKTQSRDKGVLMQM